MTPAEWEAWRDLEARLRADARPCPPRGRTIRGTASRWLWACLDAYARAYFPTEIVGRVDPCLPMNLPTNVPFPP